MATPISRFAAVAQMAASAVFLGLFLASTACGNDAERKALFARVNPSVVQVRQENGSLGSGFVVVVKGDEAIAATNYHVVEGAKKITIFFPAVDWEMKNGLEADGFVDVLPPMDLALVHFKLKGKKVEPLKLAKNLPEQGDTVYTFGSPVGQKNTIAVGMVSCVRTGKEVAALMDRLAKDAYKKYMGYDLKADWIQHTAPMSHGNSGGPLVNEKGEVVGLNTMNFAQEGTAVGGQNLNYSISARHLQTMIDRAGRNVKPWSALPRPREEHGLAAIGDVGRTLTVWKEMNRALNTLNKKLGDYENKFKKIRPRQSRSSHGRADHPNEKEVGPLRRHGRGLHRVRRPSRRPDTRNIDPRLISLSMAEVSLPSERPSLATRSA